MRRRVRRSAVPPARHRAASPAERDASRARPLGVPSDLALRRTLTVRSSEDGAKLVLTKKRGESIEHVLMKAALWALYRPLFPDLRVEVRIGDAFKPDLVALRPPPGGIAYGDPAPVFWAEAGAVSGRKWTSLLRRFPDAHVAWARWDERLAPHVATVRRALGTRARRAPFDVLRVPSDLAERITPDGTLALSLADVEHVRLPGDP